MTERPKTPEALRLLSPVERLHWMIQACDDSVERCRHNLLLSRTWVEDHFNGLAQVLTELQEDLKDGR